MSKIYPFRAMYFNPDVIKDFASIIAPPEFRADSIDEIRECKSISDFNICNFLEPSYLESSVSLLKKNVKKLKREQKSTRLVIDDLRNKHFDEHYRNIAKKFAGWLETGKIFRDEKPGIYLYERDFWDEELRIMRTKRSILALLTLEDPEEGSIKFTYKPDDEAVEQAYRLMKITFSQFSPVILGYSDPKNSVQTMLRQVIDDQPSVFAYDKEGFFHSIRAIHDEGIIDALQKVFNDFTFGIIDGAHSYMAAYKFMQEMKRIEHTGSGTETVGNVFVNLIALDNDDYTDFESASKVLTIDDAKTFKPREANKQTIFKRISQSDTEEFKTEMKEQKELEKDEFDESNPFGLNFIKTWANEYFEIEEIDWQLDFETVESEQNTLKSANDTKQAVLFIPSESKFLRLKITDDEALKRILSSKKITTSDKLDINLFWGGFLKKLYAGFDDDKHSMNIWDVSLLRNFLEKAKTSDILNVEESSDADEFTDMMPKNLRFMPGYLLSEEDIIENLSKTGIFMLFKKPEVEEILTLIHEDTAPSRQVYRLRNFTFTGLVSYRMDMSEEKDIDEDDE